jgi:hypothetical protein
MVGAGEGVDAEARSFGHLPGDRWRLHTHRLAVPARPHPHSCVDRRVVRCGAGHGIQWIPSVPRAIRGASYIIVSWIAVFTMPQLLHGLGTGGFLLFISAGACYTLGALALATRWPDPWPKVFGFHEVFHACTVVAASLHFVAIATVVAPRL